MYESERYCKNVNKVSNDSYQKHFWKVDSYTDWASFKRKLNKVLETWENNVDSIAEKVAKKVSLVKNYRYSWDIDLDKMLMARRQSNKLQRFHSTTRTWDTELGKKICDIYLKRKQLVQEVIKLV